MRPRLLDLFCGAGGSAVGYHRAGFDVVGVDHVFQPRYPFRFVRGDALEYLAAHGLEFDAVHASPPCQRYSRCRNMTWLAGRDYPDLLPATVEALATLGRPWVVENVPGAPLTFAVVLCGTHFGLRLRRHRLFASSLLLLAPPLPCRHRADDLSLAGNRFGLLGHRASSYRCADGSVRHRCPTVRARDAGAAMGIDWMTRDELSQAVPPAYTEFLGRQLIACVTRSEA